MESLSPYKKEIYFDIDVEKIFDIVHNELSSLWVAIRYFIQELSNSVMAVVTNS